MRLSTPFNYSLFYTIQKGINMQTRQSLTDTYMRLVARRKNSRQESAERVAGDWSYTGDYSLGVGKCYARLLVQTFQ